MPFKSPETTVYSFSFGGSTQGHFCENPRCNLHGLPPFDSLVVNCGPVSNYVVEQYLNDFYSHTYCKPKVSGNPVQAVKIEQAMTEIHRHKVEVVVNGVIINAMYCTNCMAFLKSLCYSSNPFEIDGIKTKPHK